jgi:hypothetical protein
LAQPFSLQAPEEIAKEYAGNKAKIAQATQMGLVDPTAAVLAGMFIDRMRSAQMMEQAPQQTVAQQVLAPQQAMPAAPAGLGATPPAAGAPMAQMFAQAPTPEAAPGLAGGGLAGLYVPDAMFDEPDGGGYAGGGLVAFSIGGDTSTNPFAAEQESFIGDAMKRFFSPEDEALFGEATQTAREEYSPENMEKRRKQSVWSAVTKFGVELMNADAANGIAGAIGQAAAATLPGIEADAKERRELRKEAIDRLISLSGAKRDIAAKAVDAGMASWKAQREVEEFQQELSTRVSEGEKNRATQLAVAAPKLDAEVEDYIQSKLASGEAKTRSEAYDLYYKNRYAGRTPGGLTIPGVTETGGDGQERIRLEPI